MRLTTTSISAGPSCRKASDMADCNSTGSSTRTPWIPALFARGNDRVETFSSTGTFESTFGSYGAGNGQFNYPWGMAVAPTGMVYVADIYNNRIDQLFDPSSWVSGTNSFTNSAIGPTSVGVGSAQLLGTSFTLNSGVGLVVGNTLSINSGGSLAQSGGSLGTSVLSVAGTFTYMGGAFSASTLVIGSSGAMQLGPGTGGQSISSLSISSGGTLDIANNHLIIDYGSNSDPSTTILGYLASGANGGAWNGTGIISSTAAGNPNYGVGYSEGADGVDPNLTSGEIEVAYAQYGDITLQGLVNANDFHILASNFGLVVTGGWEDGDFLYTGAVRRGLPSADDQLRPHRLGGGHLDARQRLGCHRRVRAAANGLTVTSNVPEPASMGLLVLVGAGALTRRSRGGRVPCGSAPPPL
jgi:NHL repeat/PEP-CTERM motif